MHVYCLRAPSVVMTLEGSPRYRGGSCAICTGPASYVIIPWSYIHIDLNVKLKPQVKYSQ